MTLEEYCIKNPVESKILNLYWSWKYDPVRSIESDKIDSTILKEGRKWFVLEKKERRNSIDLLVKENPIFKPIESFMSRLGSIYKILKLTKEEESLIKYKLSLVYNSKFNKIILEVYLEEGFVNIYKIYNHGIKKERLSIGKRFDEDYIVFDIGSKERGQEVYLLTKKETFFKEGGDIEWIKK